MDKKKCSDTPLKTGTMNRNNSGIRKKGQQSNHDEYIVPPEMEAWIDGPLYLIIARWCCLQKRWINRNDIAAAFHLPDRQASFQLSYISRKKDRVISRCRNNSAIDSRQNRNEIWVDRILPARTDASQKDLQSQSKPVKPSGSTSRRVGSGMTGNVSLWDSLLKPVRKGQDDE